MIPTLIGNLVGGGLFVAAAYWYLYLTGEGDIAVTFNIGSLDTAMEAGGPMRRTKKEQAEEDNTIVGTDPDHLPHSGGQLTSGVGMELGDHTPYTKSHSERTNGGNSSEEKV